MSDVEMTSNSNSHNSDQQSFSANKNRQASHSVDAMQRDRFEMLSAYLDGEVSADERRQVEEWLANDPTIQRLHTRLVKLRQAFQTMPVPTSSEEAVQQTVDAVLARVDRRPRLSLIWGGIAAAAVAVGAISSVLLGDNSPLPQLAGNQSDTQTAQTNNPNAEPLLIALDEPLVSIPKTPVASPNAENARFPVESNDNVR